MKKRSGVDLCKVSEQRPAKAFYEEGNFVFLEEKRGQMDCDKTVIASQRYY